MCQGFIILALTRRISILLLAVELINMALLKAPRLFVGSMIICALIVFRGRITFVGVINFKQLHDTSIFPMAIGLSPLFSILTYFEICFVSV